MRGAGARKSFGWQTSVGRVACLLHREVARPVGEPERVLAGKKFVAPFDAGRGWTEGETVRVIGIPQKSLLTTAYGFPLVGSRYDGRCSRASARLALTGTAMQGPSDSQVNSPSPSARSVMLDSTSGEVRTFDSGVPAGDNGTPEVDTAW